MSNPITRLASGALDVVLFAAGLAEGAARGVLHRVGRHVGPKKSTPEPTTTSPSEASTSTPAPAADTPTPREMPRPREPQWAPDPDDIGVETPVGTTGAGPAYNPDTAEADLQQPGTEQIMEPSTTKRIKAETDTLRRAAERNPK